MTKYINGIKSVDTFIYLRSLITICSIFRYDVERWSLKESDERKIDTVEMH